MNIGYARVSTEEQNLERQKRLLHEAGCEKIFTDKDSGRQMKRKGFEEAKSYLRDGDTLFVHDLNRLGRNMQAIKDEWEFLMRKNVHIVVLNMPLLDTRQYGEANSIGNVLMNLTKDILAWIAEDEWQRRKDSQEQGIQIAKEQGKYKGKKTEYSPTGRHRDRYFLIIEYLKQGYSQQEIAERLKCSRSTVQRIKSRENL